MGLNTRTTAGIRTGCFSNTVFFLTEVLALEIAHYDKENEFVQLELPSGDILEVFGSKSLWHPFTTTPDWEIIIADVHNRKENTAERIKKEKPMQTVISKDGTKIAFEKVGSGPAVILVNGAMSYRRAFGTTLEDLAELLGEHFTVYNYDRRGRGESGDTEPFTKVREVEDIQALLEQTGGEAMLVGFSSGGAVALETTAVTPGVAKAFVYEVPFIVDDSRQPLDDYEGHTSKLAADGKLDELIEYFVTEVAGVPAEYVGGIKQDQAMWARMRAIAPTIPHDAAFMSEFMKGRPLPAGYWSRVKVPVLVGDGGASPAWLRHAGDALAEALPNVSRKTFEGQTHSVDPNVLAPAIIEFFRQ